MPQIIPILVGIAAATTAGTSIYEATQAGGGSSQPDPNAGLTQQTKDNASSQQSEKAAIARQIPGIQSQLGGSVSPDYYAAEAAREAGFPGDQNIARTALSNFLGLGSTPENQGASATQLGGSQGYQFNPLSVNPEPGGGISGGYS